MSFRRDVVRLCFCFIGLQVTYLTWGIIQEKIITKEYITSDGKVAKFDNSQFLVFINRILSFVLSALWLYFTQQPNHCCPWFKYLFCSISNTVSSWCQYEALKYVSFISQVLAKSSKLIPVMIMGKFIMKSNYKRYEYVTAGTISMGILLFMLSSSQKSTKSMETTLIGLFLLSVYLITDSFTSNWQNALFESYKMTSIQMMCRVNFFSTMLSLVSLLFSNQLFNCVKFMFDCPSFLVDCCVLSVCSTFGQFFIFNTINLFGAVVFTIIMTVRQVLSIFLSYIIYNHSIGPFGFLGIIIIFISLFARTYFNYRSKQRVNIKVESSENVV